MKPLHIIFAFLLLLIATPFFAHTQDREQLTVPLTDPSKEGKLKIGIVTGSIKVVGYEGKEIIIDAVASDKKEQKNSYTNDRGNGMKKIITNAGFEITAKENNNQVSIGTDQVNREINFTIKVPKRFSLKLSTVNNGDIWVENVEGNHEISNVNGHINMKNISGSVVANTINQDINVNFTEVSSSTPMAFTTINGAVDITFPANIKTNVKLKTDRGEVFSDFDVDVDKSPTKIIQSADKEKGMYKIKKDDWTQGKINGGGSEIMMKTMNGNIYIRKNK
ncbi:MAG: hypothetical protein R2822_16525 [Spirosomataceae bacterium]